MKNIILTTLNARYSHTSLALRYLYANLHELQQSSQILEFVINSSPQTIAEEILSHSPKIVGIGVYIWNAYDVGEIVKVIKKVSPQTIVILGGPEVSYTPFRVNFDMADYIISGEGEESFYTLCKEILEGNQPKERTIKSKGVDFTAIKLPYDYYTDFDIQNRHIYVESSRGCPFECEFCLSSIDLKMRYLPLEVILSELEKLWV
ncbi:MAG: cobalamin-dependent protein, partial [Arcobacteraceae bacterium]